MKTFSAVVERCPSTGLLIEHVPGFPGAYSQGETLEELKSNLQEVIQMLLEDGKPELASGFSRFNGQVAKSSAQATMNTMPIQHRQFTLSNRQWPLPKAGDLTG